MKIIVVADTHKEFQKFKGIVERNLDADMFIHLGDGEHEFVDVANLFPQKKFHFVKGEADFGDYKHEDIIEAGGFRILCVHGNEHGVQDGLQQLINTAKSCDCKIALYGHTHMYRTELSDGIYVMNPGAVDSPRGKNRPSYGVINIDGNGKLTMNIVALKG